MPLDKSQNDSAQGWREVTQPRLRYGPARERFYANLAFVGECWEYQCAIDRKGYRRFKDDNGKSVFLHRYAYELIVGPIPDGLTLDHLCRNRGCCNPHHLEPVTAAENTRRGAAGEWQKAKTHCPQGHEYTEENTYVWQNGRRCWTCKRERVRLARAKRRESACG